MKRIWWSWDIRMKWAHGFSQIADSFVQNYREAVDAAAKYGVEGIVVWGFLRDKHGGVDAAGQICEYANDKGVMILPGIGIDAYGGVYYEGASQYSLDTYLQDHPEAQARNEDGTPFTFRHPKNDKTERRIGCPSNEALMDYYRESLEWLLDTFDLKGFQIEQGDVGVCHCERCEARDRTFNAKKAENVCADDMKKRTKPLVEYALEKRPDLTIIVENYTGMLPDEIRAMEPFIKDFPEAIYHSWQAYTAGHHRNDFAPWFKITEESWSPTPHGCLAIRTNSDFTDGEMDDRENIREVLKLGQKVGLDMTYIYGEYPDTWPTTRANYEVWAE